MLEITSPHTIYFFDIPYLFDFYHALINYVVHNKLELNLHHKNPHILLDPPLKLRLDESIRSRVFEFSWSSVVTPTPYAYPNLLNKSIDPFWTQVPHCFGCHFGFCWCRWEFNHGRWRCYAFESFSYTNRTRRARRSTAWGECFSTAARRRTV